MRISSLFFTGLVGLALFACSDDNLVDNGGNGVNEVSQGYIKLNISAPKTRTIGTNPSEAGTGNEVKVNNVTIVLTGSSGIIKEAVKVGMDGSAPSNIKTTATKVSAGTHFVYALVNYKGETNTLTGNLIDKVIEIYSVEDATSGYQGGEFLMVNEYNGSAIAGQPNGGALATITAANNSEENALNVSISVDRVAVKIEDSTTSPDVSALAAASNAVVNGVDIEGFNVLNINKKFNLLQKWVNVNTDIVLSTPLFDGNPAENISSFYFNNIGDYTKLDKNIDGDITGIIDLTKNVTFHNNPVYAIENRPAYTTLTTGEYTSGKGETTGVIYKVIAKKNNSDVGTFYKFNNTVSTNFLTVKAAAGDASLPDSPTPADYPNIRTKGIQVYENGVMYYTYYIKDNNVNHQIGGKDYYGVFRNSIYRLSINTFSKIGDDVPGGSINPIDPTDPTGPTNPPIDVDETYMTVTVTIKDWALSTIGVDF